MKSALSVFLRALIGLVLLSQAFSVCALQAGADGELEKLIQSTLNKSHQPEVIRGRLEEWSTANAAHLPNFVRWPGTEFDVLIGEVDADSKSGVVIAHLASENEARLMFFNGGDDWRLSRTIVLDPRFTLLLTQTQLRRIDLNGDGEKDFVVRFIGEGRIYPASSDCIIVPALQYQKCWEQAAADDGGTYFGGSPHSSENPVSQITDLNSDGKYEVIVVSLVVKRDLATAAFWPDIYQWNEKGYELANRSFPKFYERFGREIDRQISREGSNPTLLEIRKRINVILGK